MHLYLTIKLENSETGDSTGINLAKGGEDLYNKNIEVGRMKWEDPRR